MSVEIIGIFVLAGAVGTFIHKFDQQMKELGISKSDLKIIFSGLLLFVHTDTIIIAVKTKTNG